MKLAVRAAALLQQHWWRQPRSALSWSLEPLAQLYGLLAAAHRQGVQRRKGPVPMLVVGNIVVGGAGKTPTVIALVQALLAAGHRPAVLSRGYGRAGTQLHAVSPTDDAATAGDEPLLIQRRTGVPVWVGSNRVAVARALCQQHPQVDVLVSDDGLQHHALARDAEVLVFDERGVGNAALLPAGPLREPLPKALSTQQLVLYTHGQASTPLSGALALRHLGEAWPLAAWQQGDVSQCVPLSALQGRRLLAVAGLAAPEKFFGMLRGQGLHIQPMPLPDHHPYKRLPWPAGTPEVITTEKDAVKLQPGRVGSTAVWVVPLDLQLPAGFVGELTALLFPAP